MGGNVCAGLVRAWKSEGLLSNSKLNMIEAMRPAKPYPDAKLRAIALEFHKRAFGEEMARVNFLPVSERKKYLNRVRLRKARVEQK
jgi:hypothetical protein